MKIIAEIGINHDGSLEKAEALVEAAASSGCNAVKFQYRNLSRTHVASHNEIGDEILKEETSRAYLRPEDLTRLASLSRSLGLEVGISFFTKEDIGDFPEPFHTFDFFKIPSVELQNRPLLEYLLPSSKHIYISLGAQYEKDIDAVLSTLPDDESWTPMHCVSNYPVAMHNSSLGYLEFMSQKWARPIGFSSHDEHYEACLLAMLQGISVIERHITLDKDALGLDHRSSSTPDEFAKLRYFADNLPQIMAGNKPRVPNNGELINLQNLGRSLYAKRDLRPGFVTPEDFVYRSPRVGLGFELFDNADSIKISGSLEINKPVTKSLLSGETVLDQWHLDFANRNLLALPVRVHDYADISRKFSLESFEFHLSHQEVMSEFDFLELVKPQHKFSIHIPDYISGTELLDPFYSNTAVKKSREILERVGELAQKLQGITGKNVPIVGSFSNAPKGKRHFYENVARLIEEFASHGLSLMPQWLPPFAWYFGGSQRLTVFNDAHDVELVENHGFTICLDTSHLLMGANYFDVDKFALFERLIARAGHVHIADAQGVDGEGTGVSGLEIGNWDLISRAIDAPFTKVIEVWQGHLDNFEGFAREIKSLADRGHLS